VASGTCKIRRLRSAVAIGSMAVNLEVDILQKVVTSLNGSPCTCLDVHKCNSETSER